ncbi:MAG: radical SAM protein [Planctomycetota bacterium]|jgi:MoaA/NifB/PqqE/SkfB family radical SAM enzyme
MVDQERSDKVMNEALAEASVLDEPQKRNVLLKSRDLLEKRLEWESVPFRLVVEFNRRCNGRCIPCDIPRENPGDLDYGLFELLMDEAGWGAMDIMPFMGGEPTLAPMDRIAATARRHHTYLTFCTNGRLFDRAYYEAIADITGRVSFSFNSHRREIFEYISPGADYEAVVKNIGDAVRIAERTGAHIMTSLLLMKSNLEELDDYIRFVADLGVRRVSVQKLYPDTGIMDTEGIEGESITPLLSALEAAKKRSVFIETNVEGLFHAPSNVKTQKLPFDILQENGAVVDLYHPGFCIPTATAVYVEWDGTVLPCSRERIILGSLHENSFNALWNGEVMRGLRASFFDAGLRPFCSRCMQFYCGHA